MKYLRFVPDSFSLGLGILGAALLAFPSLRVAGLIALALAVIYWLFFSVLKIGRR